MSKRRKIDQGHHGLHHRGLIDFKSRDATQLSTATTFALQTDELLHEARLDYAKALEGADARLFQLKEILEAIESHGPVSISQATAELEKKHRIVIPYPDPRPSLDAPYKVSFEKPAQCNVVGSYVCKTMIRSQMALAADMVVQMPESLFQSKDYQDMRYFYRRAYFIAFISVHIRSALGDAVQLTYEHLHDNPLLPILVLRFKSPGSQDNSKSNKRSFYEPGYSVKLIPCAPDDLFPWAKLTPTSTCYRIGDADKETNSATPFYNSTLNAERNFLQYLRLLSHARKECPAFPDACILGRIWLQQRGFGGAISQGGFGHFEWAVIVALLMGVDGNNDQSVLSTSLSSMELFKATVQFLATNDFNKKSFVFGVPGVGLKAICEAGPVVFDSGRDLNIAFKMTPWSASLLQVYAMSTSNLLADEATNKFEATFIRRADSMSQLFDSTFQIDCPGLLTRFLATADRSSPTQKFSLEAYRVLSKAYGERVQLVHLRHTRGVPWPLNSKSLSQATKVAVGVVFNPAQMVRQMEYGPTAENAAEAAAFRRFWGEKAELRRFKDGSILECVEWMSKLPNQIAEEIARYALGRHMKITHDELLPRTADFSAIIQSTHLDKEAFDSSRRAFSKLEQDIRNLEDLPLQIRQLSPVSPQLRYSAVEPPSLSFHKDIVEPIDVQVYFEASAKWPENLTAIQEAKIEFLLDIDKRLTGAHQHVKTSLGRENTENGIANLAFLDVTYDNGAAFRIRVHCDLEETLLKRRAADPSLGHREREESAECLAGLCWSYKTLPLHTQTIATYCTRLPALSQSIRLVRHWFDRHKLSGHFNAELIELFVLHVFLKPFPWPVPSSPATGFLRTLSFLARWDWRREPLIVDAAEALSGEDIASIGRELELCRKRDPQMNRAPLFVATNHDRTGTAYTRDGPSTLVASRMTRLARASSKFADDPSGDFTPSALFRTSLRDYDVLIHLSAKAVRGVARDASSGPDARRPARFKNLDERTGNAPKPARAHPVDVLADELQRAYRDTIIWFRGGVDDTVLAAIWRPTLPPPPQGVRFRAGLPYNFCRLAGGEGCDGSQVGVNREAVLLEIARAGGDLIKKIEVVDDVDEA